MAGGMTNTAYDIQRVWDCAALDPTTTNTNPSYTCANGLNVPSFFNTLYTLYNSTLSTGIFAQTSRAITQPVVITAANSSKCKMGKPTLLKKRHHNPCS